MSNHVRTDFLGVWKFKSDMCFQSHCITCIVASRMLGGDRDAEDGPETRPYLVGDGRPSKQCLAKTVTRMVHVRRSTKGG
ncbi:MAG: hypothetical protein CMJ48_03585 [Planctomycetaceae bacterium]|nr:hypothetical protein [Planctomycetaceae bacterium]